MAQATDETKPAAESEESAHDNEVVIEDAGPAKKKITITIPAETVDEKIDTSLSTLTTEAALPGFRKGRAPRALIERRFGTQVRDETRNQLIADAYTKAIEEHKLRTVGDPDAEGIEDLKVEPGKPLTFSVEVEVAPEFEVPDLKDMTIRKPIVEVMDKHIDEELERQLWRHGAPDDLEDKVSVGDRVQGHAVVTDRDSEELISDLPDAIVAMPTSKDNPRGHVLGLFVEDMFELFKDKGVGDTIVHEATISETDERPSLRGRNVRVDFTIERGSRMKPATVEEVVQTYGLAGEEALRDEVRKALEDRAEQETHAAMREQVADQLGDLIDFELPEKLTARQAQRSLDRQRIELLYRGLPMDDVEVRIAELRGESQEQSRRRLKMFFILNRLAEDFDIQVNEQEINGRIAMMAAQRGERPEKLRSELIESGQIQQVALQIREHKTIDRLIAEAKVEEISAEAWNKMVEERQQVMR